MPSVQLSLRSDYALRVLLYLGAHPGEVVTTQRISDAYGISKNHLVRVVQTLAGHGYVDLIPGRSGGIRLARDPAGIRLGEVVRQAAIHAVSVRRDKEAVPQLVALLSSPSLANRRAAAFLERDGKS